MRKTLLVSGIILLLPLITAGQEYPKAEVFGGYSYLRGDFDANFHGWNASVAGNPTRWFGVVADFSGHYFDEFKVHSFLFGPRFTYRGNDRVNPYVHTLFGAVRASNGSSETAFGWTVGAGLDIKVSKNVAVRVIEVNYLLTRFDDLNQHNGRLATGLVWRFGGD